MRGAGHAPDEPGRWLRLFPGPVAGAGGPADERWFAAALPVQPGAWWAPIVAAPAPGTDEQGGPMTGAQQLRLITASAACGRITASGAVRWARRAASGEDVSILAQLEAAGPPVREPALSRVTGEVAAILGGVAASSADYRFATDSADLAAAAAADDGEDEFTWDPGDGTGPAPPGFAVIFPDHAAAAIEADNTWEGPGHAAAVRPPWIYPGQDQGKPGRTPVTSWDGYTQASAGDDEQDDDGGLFPAGDTSWDGYVAGAADDGEDEPAWPYWELQEDAEMDALFADRAVRGAAGDDDLTVEEAYRALFGDHRWTAR